MPSNVPKLIHFSIINDVDSSNLDYIKIWADMNPAYTIKVWHNETMFLRKLLYKELFNYFKNDIPQNGFKDDYGKLDTIIWEQIYDFEGHDMNQRLGDRIQSFFSGAISQAIRSNVIYELNKRRGFFQQIKLIKNANAFEYSENWEDQYFDIIESSLSLSDSWMAERFIALRALHMEGGIYLSNDVLPKLNARIFSKRRMPDGSISSIPDSDTNTESLTTNNLKSNLLERFKINEALKKMSSEGLIFAGQGNLDLPAELPVSQDEIARIKNIIRSNDYKNIFSGIGTVRIKNKETVYVGYKGEDDLRQPLVIVSLPDSPLIRDVIDEASHIYDLANNFMKKGGSVEKAESRILKGLKTYYASKKINLSPGALRDLKLAASNLVGGTVTQYGVSNEIMSVKSLERTAINQMEKYKLSIFDDYTSKTPNANKEIKPYSFNKLEIFGKISYDSLVLIELNKDNDLAQSIHEYYINNSVDGNSVFYRFDSSSKELKIVTGSPPVNIGQKTKVVIAGHGSTRGLSPLKIEKIQGRIPGFSVQGHSPEELASILSKVVPRGAELKKIVLDVCFPAEGLRDFKGTLDQTQKLYVPEFLRALAKKHIFAVTTTARNRASSVDTFSRRLYEFPKLVRKANSGQGAGRIKEGGVEVRYPELTRYIYTLDSDHKTVHYQAKLGLASYDPDVSSIDPTLPDSNLFPSVFLTKWPSSKTQGTGFLYSSINDVIKHGLQYEKKASYVVYANKNKSDIHRLLKTLKLALRATSHTDWVDLCKSYFPPFINEIQGGLASYQSGSEKQAAFSRLKTRISEGQFFHIYHLDYLTSEGAAILNFRYRQPFSNISISPARLSCHRRRRSNSVQGCSSSARLKEAISSVILLSGPETQLILDGANTDIALIDTSRQSQLATLQQSFVNFRRQEAKAQLRSRTGYQNFIALDDPSFTLAKNKVTTAGKNARAFLLKVTVSSGNVLLSTEGAVRSGIEGGDGNQVTLLGRTESLTANIMATVIAEFTPDGAISQLTLTGMTVDGLANDSFTLQELSRFINNPKGKYQIEELVIQPLDAQPESIKPLAQRIATLSGHNRQAVKGITLRPNNEPGLEYRIFPGETRALQQAAGLSGPGLPVSLPASGSPGITSADLPEADSRQKDFTKAAIFRAELQQRLLEFDVALDAIKSRHNLSYDTVPLLNSLTRDKNLWRMDFVQPGITGKTSLTFESGAFQRFKTFVADHDRQIMGEGKGKKLFRSGSNAVAGFMTLSDIVETIVSLGKVQQIKRSEGMTESQYQIHLGRQYLFYMATALQGAEIVDLGIQGIKVILPEKSHKALAALGASASGKGKLSKILSYSRKLKPLTKVGRLLPVVGTGLQGANLGLTMAEYADADDPQVQELLESKVTFDIVDTKLSLASEVMGQYGLIVDGVMLFARAIFEDWYEEELDELYLDKLHQTANSAPEKLNPLHKYLNPGWFVNDSIFLNFLRRTGERKKSLLPISIREINLVNSTLTYGRVYAHQQHLTSAGESAHLTSGSRFDMVASALKTLCRDDGRLKKYQCADGVYKNIAFRGKPHNTILMPALPDRSLSLTYTKSEKTYRKLNSERCPGAIFLDAIEDHLLKRRYAITVWEKIKNRVSRSVFVSGLERAGFSEEEANKLYDELPKYAPKLQDFLLTNIEEGDTLKTSSTLYMDDQNYKLIFSNIKNTKYTEQLDYKIHALKGARRTYTLLSDGPHTINLTPNEHTASLWFLAYAGGTDYVCIAEEDRAIKNCQSEGAGGEGSKPGHIKHVKLGETQYYFNTPTNETTTEARAPYTYKVMSSDANALFEFMPGGKNKIYQFYSKSEINDTISREQTFTQLLNRYTPATRFVPVKLKGCDSEDRLPISSGEDYSCFPDRLGLPEAESGKLDRVLVWHDSQYNKEIQYIGENTNIRPVQGSPDLGYYFLNPNADEVFFKKYHALRHSIDRFEVFSAHYAGSFFGPYALDLHRTKDPSTLIAFSGIYYYLLSVDGEGEISHKKIAVETTDRKLSSHLDGFRNDSFVPMHIVDDRRTRNLLRSGFYDNGPKVYIAYRSSLFDGGRLSKKDGRTLEIDADLQKTLQNEHLPVHKITEGKTAYYILFSQQSGNLIYLSADIPDDKEKREVRRIDSGFHVIRPATENGTMPELKQPAFTRVQAFSGSILADTHHGYRLRIPDASWGSTQEVSSARSVELDSFDQWQVKATGEIIPKSNDTVSVERFTDRSGITLEGLDFGRLVNYAFNHTFKSEAPSGWTRQNAATFVTALKKDINKKIHHADRDFSASPGLLKLPLITGLTNHSLLAFINNQNFWYLPSSNTLFTAPARGQFKITGSGDNQLMARLNGTADEAYEFFLKPNQARKGHPFCGKEATVHSELPGAFDIHLSVPCDYPLYNRTILEGEYKWDQKQQLWTIKVGVARFEGDREHFRLVELDIGQSSSEKPVTYDPGDFPYGVYHEYLNAMQTLTEKLDSSKLAGTTLIALRLKRTAKTVANPVRGAWFDYQNHLLYAGLPGQPHENLKLLGGKTHLTEKLHAWSQGVVYDQKSRLLTQTGGVMRWQAGPFKQVEVTDSGLRIEGTPGNDQFRLSHLHLGLFYTTRGVRFIDRQLSPEQRNFSVYLEGSGGTDLFVLKENDLGYFSSVIIHPGLSSLTYQSGSYSPTPANTPSATLSSTPSGTPSGKHSDHNPNIIRLKSPSYLYAVERQGQDLVLFNRFQPDTGKLRIQQVWPGLFDRPLQPTTLTFRDIHVSIQQLAGEVSRQSGRVVLPMLIDERKALGTTRHSLTVTAETPLYIKLSRGFAISTRQAMNGVNMVFHSGNQLGGTSGPRRRVFIENSHSHGLVANSVWVQQPDSQSYTPWQVKPVIVHSSLLPGRRKIVKGNAHRNILFVGRETGRRRIQGMGESDILLLGSVEKTDSQLKSMMLPLPVIEGDRCHSEKVYIQLSPDSSGEAADLVPTLEGGAGSDLYDLRHLRAVRTLDSKGQHHVLLSSRSVSDLRGLSGDKSVNLFFTDLKADEVTFDVCDPATGRQKTLMSEGKAVDGNTSTADLQVIKIIKPSGVTLALVSAGTLKSLYFMDGKVTRDPQAWLQGKSSLSASDAKKGALGFVYKLVKKAKHPLDYLMQTIGGTKDDTKSQQTLSPDIEMASHNAEIYRHFQGMVQAISALGGEPVGDSLVFAPKVSQNSTIVASPLVNNGTGVG